MDVEIGSIQTQVTLTEGVGGLSPEEIQKVVQLVMAQLKTQQRQEESRLADVTIHDRVYRKKGL